MDFKNLFSLSYLNDKVAEGKDLMAEFIRGGPGLPFLTPSHNLPSPGSDEGAAEDFDPFLPGDEDLPPPIDDQTFVAPPENQ